MSERRGKQCRIARLVGELCPHPGGGPVGARHEPPEAGRLVTAAQLHDLVEGDLEGDVGEKGCLVIVRGFDDPAPAFALVGKLKLMIAPRAGNRVGLFAGVCQEATGRPEAGLRGDRGTGASGGLPLTDRTTLR